MSVPGAAALREMLQATANRLTVMSDRELLREFSHSGDQAAFAALFRRHSGMVLGVCRRMLANVQDAEDACQATFVILARKARSERWQTSLGNWLYATARRVAGNARVARDRRLRREGRAVAPESVEPVDRMTGREMLAILDEELEKLPPRYREPLILCYLQGLTRDEAAMRLNVPPATLKSHLERGRQRLADALARRGCVPGASLLALAAISPPRSVPQRLHSAVLAAAAGNPSGAVAGLAEGTTRNVTAKVKLLAALVGLFALTIGAGGANRTGFERESQNMIADDITEPGRDDAPASQARTDHGPAITVSGRVIGSTGRALAGAGLFLIHLNDEPINVGVSGADGRFTVALPNLNWSSYLVARAEGQGFDFVALSPTDPRVEIEFRLVKDNPVRGRIVDTQGKPLAGVRVWIIQISAYENDSLDPFLVAWKKRPFYDNAPLGLKNFWRHEPTPLFPVTTDREGRFTLTGAGAERYVVLRYGAAGIADGEVRVVNRAGFDPQPYNQASRDNIPQGSEKFARRLIVNGPEPVIVAEAEKPVRGVVNAADTGKGLAGIEVELSHSGWDLLPVVLRARTDARGSFAFHGARKNPAYSLQALGDTDGGYLPCRMEVNDTSGFEPVTFDVRVSRGVVVQGKVRNAATGEAMRGFAMVCVLNDNPFVKDYTPFDAFAASAQTKEDGSFRVVTIPGPVLLMGGGDGHRLPDGSLERIYLKRPIADPNYPRYFTRDKFHPLLYRVGSVGGNPVQGSWCKVLEIKPGTATVDQDVLLEPAPTFEIRIRDAVGKPLIGALVAGTSPWEYQSPAVCKTDTCIAYDLRPAESRRLVFFEPTRKLAAALTVKGNEKAPTEVNLRPTGSIRGRLVDTNGMPIAKVRVDWQYTDPRADRIRELTHPAREVISDANGAFTIDTVLPLSPLEFSFQRQKKQFKIVAKHSPEPVVDFGEAKDLGNIAVR